MKWILPIPKQSAKRDSSKMPPKVLRAQMYNQPIQVSFMRSLKRRHAALTALGFLTAVSLMRLVSID
jgi:hypothetical protein